MKTATINSFDGYKFEITFERDFKPGEPIPRVIEVYARHNDTFYNKVDNRIAADGSRNVYFPDFYGADFKITIKNCSKFTGGLPVRYININLFRHVAYHMIGTKDFS